LETDDSRLFSCEIGLERNDFYITYEPVGHMFRNSRGITPRNNILFDSFWSLVGTVRPSNSFRRSFEIGWSTLALTLWNHWIDRPTYMGMDSSGRGSEEGGSKNSIIENEAIETRSIKQTFIYPGDILSIARGSQGIRTDDTGTRESLGRALAERGPASHENDQLTLRSSFV